jgi:peptidoglycan/LPS O-acetylase OafA/YrhL
MIVNIKKFLINKAKIYDSIPVSFPRSRYRPDIDGLRAISILAVVIFHAFPNLMKGGFVGVDVFFVISGYLISTIIFQNLEKGTFSFYEFYARRIKRIFPSLIVVLITSFIFGYFFLLADEFNQLGKHIASGACFISNFILWNESGYFDNSAETKPLIHLWSLAIEEQFYIFMPLFAYLFWRHKFIFFTILIFLAITSFILNIKGIKHDMVSTFYSPQTRFWELLSGSLLAWFTLNKFSTFSNIKSKIDFCLSHIIYSQKSDAHGKALSNILSLVGLFLLFYGFWRINKAIPFPGKWALLPVLGAVLIISAGAKAWVNRTILSHRIAVCLGLISFPLYLWHWPLLSFARIVESEVPSSNIRVLAILISILLAWLTAKFIERPIRTGSRGNILKLTMLCGIVFLIGISGFVASRFDFSSSHGYEKLVIQRKGFEHAFGSSLSWLRGKQDWLFLGNAHGNTIAKLKMSIIPSDNETEAIKEIFSKVAEVSAKYNTKVVLIVAPNKSSVYTEYLPSELHPSTNNMYIKYFIEKLKSVPNLTVYNPTDDFLNLKNTEGILYWRTDSHWNNKGAFFAYSGFANLFGLPIPQIEFKQGATYSGDIIEISKLKNFPLHPDDNWDVIWKNKPSWTENKIPDDQKKEFGYVKVVFNDHALSNKCIWFYGDSFSEALEQYFNATFREVRYVGNWGDKLYKELSADLARADRKPDMIIVERVERSF